MYHRYDVITYGLRGTIVLCWHNVNIRVRDSHCFKTGVAGPILFCNSLHYWLQSNLTDMVGREIVCSWEEGGGSETIYRVCLKYWDKLQSFTSEHRERFTQIYVRDLVVFEFNCKITINKQHLNMHCFTYSWHNTFTMQVSNLIKASCAASHYQKTLKMHSNK